MSSKIHHRAFLSLGTATGFLTALSFPAVAQQANAPAPAAAATLPAVNVQGTDTGLANAAMAPDQPPPVDLGPLGKQPVLDTPQSVNFIPDTLILNQQVQTVNDTLRYLPSVEIRDQQGLEVSRPQSRGFQSSIVSNTRLDGLNVIGTTAIPAENLAGIQVLNGLAGALYGPESPSGVFNYILKEPTDAPFFRYIQSFDSQSLFAAHGASRDGPLPGRQRDEHILLCVDRRRIEHRRRQWRRYRLVRRPADL